jgi:hypothetical protein
MPESFNRLIEAIEKKRDYLSEICHLSEQQLNAAHENEWTEFNRLGDKIDILTKEIEAINDIVKTEYKSIKTLDDVNNLWGQEKTKKISLLLAEIHSLVEESLEIKKRANVPLVRERDKALRELQALELKQDALKAYGWPRNYQRSIPKFIDKEK